MKTVQHRSVLRALSYALLALAAAMLPPTGAKAQFAEGCWSVFSPALERYVRRDCASVSYRADGQTITGSARFYLKKCDPDHTNRFLIYDLCGHYLSSDPSGVVVRGTLPDTWGEWEVVAQSGGLFALRSVAHNRWLETASFLFGLRTVTTLGDAGKYTFTAAPGCQAPPEAMLAATNVVLATNPPNQLIWGIADTHSHAFAHLGFGGKVFWGAAYSRFGLENALRHCACVDNGVVPCLIGTQAECLQQALTNCNSGNLFSCLADALTECNVLATDLIHGPGGAFDLIGAAAADRDPLGGHDVGGFPSFNGWPRWNDVNHQQMYYKWIERAFLGGLKLLVIHAVNNESLSAKNFTGSLFAGDDTSSVSRQIQAVKEMEKFIDWQSGGPGRGWFRIAYRAAEARQIITSGKMAVVLGVEVSSLFGCRQPGDCNTASVGQKIQEYRELGVRQFFLIHHFENGFGGPAFLLPFSNVGNRIVNGGWFSNVIHSADSDLDMNGSLTNWLVALGFTGELPPYYTAPTGHVDGLGLTDLGRFAFAELMRQHLIVEVDHLSWRAADEVLAMAEARCHPVISSHTHFNELALVRDEFSLTSNHVRRIRNLGGLVSPFLHHKDLKPYSGHVTNTVNESSTTYAQAYCYAVDHLRGGPLTLGVPYGSDFSGFALHPRPRFGPEGWTNSTNPVVYPVAVDSRVGTGQFGKVQTGTKFYDFNTDGFAHVGLLPDFIQDLKNIGLSPAELDPLFRSAEAYLEMWERVERRLNLAPGPGVVVLSWALAVGDSVLEATTSLFGGPWTPVLLPYTTNGLTISVTVPVSGGSRYFRLRKSLELSLTLTRSGGSVVLAWPLDAAGAVLEATPTLAGAPPPWAPVVLPLSTNGQMISVTATITNGSRFFRLRR